MHFYDFNIGDYAKKTAHLTNEEDVAYRRALDMYYDTEEPFDLTGGLATLSRRLRVSEDALKNVIEEFFPEGKNKHADEKIVEYYAYIAKQKSNGKQGGRPKHKPTANPPVSQNNPVPSQPLPTTHYPLPIKEKPLAHPSDDAGNEKNNPLYSKQFLTFWGMYPKKKSKGDAAKAFSKINKLEYPIIRAGIENAIVTPEWKKNGGEFIPYPASWLRDRGWEDEISVIPESEKTQADVMQDFLKRVT